MNLLKKISSGERPSSEDKILEKGRKMLEKNYEEQKSFGLKLQDKYDTLTNSDILTTALPFNEEIPEKYRNRIRSYREKVKAIIFGIATEIQGKKFQALDKDVKSSGLSKFQERRYVKVRDAQKEIYVSYDAIRESLNYIRDFNNHILQRIEESKDSRKTDLLLLNAIVIYELTDAIIELIRDFKLRGKETLRVINEQVKNELQEQESQDEDLWKRASSSDGQVQKGVRYSIEERCKIRKMVEDKWIKIWQQVDELEENMESAKGFLPTLELIRDNAKGQIDILEVIGITQIVQNNIRNLQDICAVTDIKLAPLSKEDAIGLVGKVSEESIT